MPPTKTVIIVRWIAPRLVTLARLCITLAAGWALLYFLFGDRWWWLFALNSVAACLFAPLPTALALGAATRRRDLIGGSGALLALAAYLYGGTLLPHPQTAAAAGPTLTVMSFNMLGFNTHPSAVVAALRESRADVIGIQELNPDTAAAIQRSLADIYPYQALDPRPCVTGLGVVSRYPLRPTGDVLPGSWFGTPQILRLDFGGAPVTLANVHVIPLLAARSAPLRGGLDDVVREREQQARTIARFAAAQPGPLVVTGDFNTTELSDAYRTLTGALVDSWREAGWGFGGTFPGGNVTIGGRDVSVPAWVSRIDYVFHSRDWAALSSRIGPWDGFSDHRPVIATLALTQAIGD